MQNDSIEAVAEAFEEYEILEASSGHFGSVYKIRNDRIGGRIEALKILRNPLPGLNSQDSFTRETLPWSKVDGHPNIATLYDAVEEKAGS